MHHGDYLVRIFDEQGNPIGAKPRREVDKVRDVVHCADVMVFRGAGLVLARIPTTALYGGTLGSTTGTMVREGEMADDAAKRAMERELGVTDATLTELGRHFFAYPDGVKRVKTTFVCAYDGALRPNPEDIVELVPMTRAEIEEAMTKTPEMFAPTFRSLWETYDAQLPL